MAATQLRPELLLALATIGGVLAVGILYGVLIAAGLSVLDTLRPCGPAA